MAGIRLGTWECARARLVSPAQASLPRSWPTPELRIPNAAAQTRIVSKARIRLDSRKSMRSFKGIICTSIVRVHQHGACITRNRRQSMGRSRGGLTSKIHAVVDTNGLPVRLALTAGEAHDNRLAGRLLSRLKSGAMLLADRGYDADWIRALASKRGVWANIPPRCNRNEPICFSPYLYRARNLVERFFNRIKQCRRIATRYDKLAANYLAFVQLASIRLWLRVNESTP
jgi:transposase